MSDDVLIDGVALLIGDSSGESLAHWIVGATDDEVIDKMRQWAAGEIVRQQALREQEAQRASMQQIRKSESEPERFGVVLHLPVATKNGDE